MQKAFRLGNRRRDVDMTQGSAVRHLFWFAVPLLAGNLFQQLYNVVDAWVVGNYVSNEAFSAVGTVMPIVNMLIGAFGGLAGGAGVVISQYYGAGDMRKVHDAVHTAIMVTFLFGAAFTVIGIAMTPAMLRLMKMPTSVFPDAQAYLTIYFSGAMVLMLYNMGAAILRAVGDSSRPFYYLVAAAVVNVVLDLVLVIVFDMGVAGVGYATVIAQAAAALLTLLTLTRTSGCVHVRLREVKIHGSMMKKILWVGIPAAVQMAITAFSNVFVQAYINQFGADCMSGWAAYSKIDQLIYMPMQSLGMAATTFVGQNLGLGQVKRAKKGVSTTMKMAMGSTVFITVSILLFAPQLVRFFNDKGEVVHYGTLFLYWLSPLYVFCCINEIYTGALRGAGNSRAPMLIRLFSFVLFRQIYLFIMSNYIANEILPLAMGYPAGWLMCSFLTLMYYRRVPLDKTSLVKPSPKTA